MSKMFQPYRRTGIVAIVLCLIVQANLVIAEPIDPTHTKADVIGWGRDGFNNAFYDINLESNTDIIVPTQFGIDASGFSTSAEAAVHLDGGHLLQSRASGSGPPPDAFNDKFASTLSTVAWRDALYLATGSTLPTSLVPETLAFHFSVEGQVTITDVTADQRPQWVSRAWAVVTTNGSTFSFAPLPPLPSGPADLRFLVEDIGPWTPYDSGGTTVEVTPGWDTSATDSPDGLTHHFSGTFTVISTKLAGFGLPDGGAFPISVQLSAGVSSRGGPASVDFFNTLQFTGITDPTGAPLDLGDYQFDSGIAVPAPVGLVLLAGAGPLLSRRRQRA